MCYFWRGESPVADGGLPPGRWQPFLKLNKVWWLSKNGKKEVDTATLRPGRTRHPRFYEGRWVDRLLLHINTHLLNIIKSYTFYPFLWLIHLRRQEHSLGNLSNQNQRLQFVKWKSFSKVRNWNPWSRGRVRSNDSTDPFTSGDAEASGDPGNRVSDALRARVFCFLEGFVFGRYASSIRSGLGLTATLLEGGGLGEKLGEGGASFKSMRLSLGDFGWSASGISLSSDREPQFLLKND